MAVGYCLREATRRVASELGNVDGYSLLHATCPDKAYVIDWGYWTFSITAYRSNRKVLQL